ncbi:type III pantothenate kinase [bacterium]|nr:type III pantothenate kinase [bacterium]MBU1637509.1 type III pantothenate kinase [bacterium]
MTKLLLAIDVGNTHTAVGLFKGENLLHDWRLSSKPNRTADELWILIESCLHAVDVSSKEIEQVGISSVVPRLTELYREVARKRFTSEPVIVSVNTVPKMIIDYAPPHAVGADRICSAIAGFSKFGGPLIVIDLGTATVFDVIDQNGTYLGGLIAPGLNTAADSLHRMTDALPRVELQFPSNVIGKSTVESIQSGVLYGSIEMIDGIVRRIQESLRCKTKVIATGGFSGLLKTQSATIEQIEPNLVLEGIRLVVEAQ